MTKKYFQKLQLKRLQVTITEGTKQEDSIEGVPIDTKQSQDDKIEEQKEVEEPVLQINQEALDQSKPCPMQVLKKASLSLEEVREENNSDKTSSAKASSAGKQSDKPANPVDHVILHEQVTTMFQDTPGDSSEDAPGKDYR